MGHALLWLIGLQGCASRNARICCSCTLLTWPGRNFSVLHSFTGGNDGSSPYAGVIVDRGGNRYGTTFAGGRSRHNMTPPSANVESPTP
jgi:hypothetical protein